MRSLVVYDPVVGNAELIAQAIREGLAEGGDSKVMPADLVSRTDVRDAQLVVVGGVARLGDVSLLLRGIMHGLLRKSWQGKPVAVFDTRFRGEVAGTESVAGKLEQLLRRRGAYLVSPPESFLVPDVDGSVEASDVSRALVWGRSLHLAERLMAEM
jgi:flavodoxin